MDKTKTWYFIFYILMIAILLRFFPKIAFILIAITILVLLTRIKEK